MAESAQDIIQAMGWEDSVHAGVQQSLFTEYSDEEKALLSFLNKENPISIDKLHQELNHTPSKIASLLLQLEFQGAILALPGKRYILP